jgi:hypothetical protein
MNYIVKDQQKLDECLVENRDNHYAIIHIDSSPNEHLVVTGGARCSFNLYDNSTVVFKNFIYTPTDEQSEYLYDYFIQTYHSSTAILETEKYCVFTHDESKIAKIKTNQLDMLCTLDVIKEGD